MGSWYTRGFELLFRSLQGLMVYIKLYGLQRTGTNYIQWLIENNFDDVKVLVNELGWKHGVPSDITWDGIGWSSPVSGTAERKKDEKKLLNKISPIIDDIKEKHEKNRIYYVFCVKHPYSWWKSARNGIFYRGMSDLEKFEHYAKVNSEYINFSKIKPHKTFIIRYEDYYETSYEKVLENLESHFPISRKNKNFINQTKVIRPNLEVSGSNFKKNYYKNKEYMKDGRRQKKLVTTALGEDLLQKLNYEL